MWSVSVIIPAYNAANTLPDAIDSVLNQTYLGSIEVLVVDDGSEDQTEEVARGYGNKVRYIKQDNSGPSVARNRGILASKGEFICFLDADDKLKPDMLRTLLKGFQVGKDVGVVYCGHIITDADGRVIGQSSLDMSEGDVLVALFDRGCLCAIHAALVWREAFTKAGLFNTSLKQSEDYELWIRLAVHYKFAFVPEHLVEYRQLPESNGRRYDEFARSSKVLLASLQTLLIDGLITKQHYIKVKKRIRGYPAEKAAQDAFTFYWDGDYARAARLARYAITHSLLHASNRGLWALAVKPLFRSIGAR